MSSIIDWLSSIKSAISSIPALLGQKLGFLFSDLKDNIGELGNAFGKHFSGLKESISNLGSSIGTFFSELKESISDLGSSIGKRISDLQNSVISFFKDIGEFFGQLIFEIQNLPERILNGIKAVFIPSDGFIEGKIDFLTRQFTKLGVSPYDMSSIFNKEHGFENITCKIAGREVVIVNMSFMDTVLSKFRPIIRGFMTLMLIFYNINQFLGLIGQQGMTIGGIVGGFLRVKGDDSD